MAAYRVASSRLTKQCIARRIAAEPINEVLDPKQRIALIIQPQILISVGSVKESQRTESVLYRNADSRLIGRDRMLD
jgi:hypothetical protein